MPRFAGMIATGIQQRGHATQIWTSTPRLARLPVGSAFLRKWLGYWDQFVSYPRQLRRAALQQPRDTLFVLTDQALGMWLPKIVDRPHAIHCHDFLALRSALGEFPENPTGWTGQQYQRLIRNGFSLGQNFISVSQKTQTDLHRFLSKPPKRSDVVYNGLNFPFRVLSETEVIAALRSIPLKSGDRFQTNELHQKSSAPLTRPSATLSPSDGEREGVRGRSEFRSDSHATNQALVAGLQSASGYIVHIGGNQWYKNRPGVLEIYRAYAAATPVPAELWMVGARPNAALREQAASIAAPGVVRFLSDLTNNQVNAAYCGARALLFPSLEEGFGWPIVEAMASGCPVLTTGIPPMTEVGGSAARYLPRMPVNNPAELDSWANAAAKVLNETVSLNGSAREHLVQLGLQNAARFDTDTALDTYERIYREVLESALQK